MLVQEGIRIRRHIMDEVRVRELLRDDRYQVMVVVEWLGWKLRVGYRIVAMVRVLGREGRIDLRALVMVRVLDQEGLMEIRVTVMVEALLLAGLKGFRVTVMAEVLRPEGLIGFRVTVMVVPEGLIGVRDWAMAEVLVQECRVVVRPMAMVKVVVPVEVSISLRIMVTVGLPGHRARNFLRLMALAVEADLVGAQVMAVEDPIKHHVTVMAAEVAQGRVKSVHHEGKEVVESFRFEKSLKWFMYKSKMHDSDGVLCKRSKTAMLYV